MGVWVEETKYLFEKWGIKRLH